MPSYTKASPDAERVLAHKTVVPCATPRSAIKAEQAMIDKREAQASQAQADPEQQQAEPEPEPATEAEKTDASTEQAAEQPEAEAQTAVKAITKKRLKK